MIEYFDDSRQDIACPPMLLMMPRRLEKDMGTPEVRRFMATMMLRLLDVILIPPQRSRGASFTTLLRKGVIASPLGLQRISCRGRSLPQSPHAW